MNSWVDINKTPVPKTYSLTKLTNQINESKESVKHLGSIIFDHLKDMGIDCNKSNHSNRTGCKLLSDLILYCNDLIHNIERHKTRDQTLVKNEIVRRINNYFKNVFLNNADIWKDGTKLEEQIESFALIMFNMKDFFNKQFYRSEIILVSEIKIDILEDPNSIAIDKFKIIYKDIKEKIKLLDSLEGHATYARPLAKSRKKRRSSRKKRRSSRKKRKSSRKKRKSSRKKRKSSGKKRKSSGKKRKSSGKKRKSSGKKRKRTKKKSFFGSIFGGKPKGPL